MFDIYKKELAKLGYVVYNSQVTTGRGDVVASLDPYGGVETKDEEILKLLSSPPKKDKKPKRARTKRGTYKADDPSTPDVNEAYE